MKNLTRKWWIWAIAAVVAIAIIGGIAGAFDDPQQPSPAAPVPAETTRSARPATSAPAPADKCEPVAPEMAAGILDGAETGQLEQVGDAYAVKSETGAYFVAIRFRHGAGEDTGIWQTSSLQPGGGPIGSVNSFARSYTNWPDTGNNGSAVARDAERCIR